MSVNLKHFVDIDIKQHVSGAIIGTRKTVALLTSEQVANNEPFLVNSADYKTACNGMTTVLSYLEVYFAHGGVSACIYPKIASTNITVEKIMSLPSEYICIAYATPDASENAKFVDLAKSLDANADFYGGDRKILLYRLPQETILSNEFVASPCLAIKLSDEVGAEMTIGAYLSKINVYDIDSVYDYMYTVENITATELTDAQYETLMLNNVNVDIDLANQVRNCGGNMSDGSDIVNTYVLIILHQTVTARLVELLSQKIKSSDGISKIYAVISQELSSYLTCGYLTTDKVWTDPDLTISYNNENYTIVETGTALTDGYIVKVLPFSSLTENDKALHKTPPIYIVLASQYGIRAITISGEVI